MTLDIGEALEEGFSSIFTRNAGILMGVLYLISLMTNIFGDSLIQAATRQGAAPGSAAAAPLAANIPIAVSGVGVLVFALLSSVFTIGTIRYFVSEEGEDNIKRSYFTDNLAWVLANMIIGSIAFSIIVGLGFLALIIPGFFLLASLYFWQFYVIDQNHSFIEGLRSSWRDTKNNRLRTFILLAIVLVGGGAFSLTVALILGLVAGLLGAGAATGALLGLLPSALVTVFTLATFSKAYNQISGE